MAKSLPRRINGYVRLQGKISKIKRYRKSLIMELESNSKSPIRVKIKKRNMRYFNKAEFKEINPDKLWNKTIIVTGLLKNKKGKRTLYLNYPTQLKVVDGMVGNAANSAKADGKPQKTVKLKWSLEK